MSHPPIKKTMSQGKPLLLLLALYFIVTLAFSGFEATFALFSEAKFGFNTSTIGFVFAFIGVVLATVQGALVGRAVKKLGERRLIPIAIIAIAACGSNFRAR